MLGPKDVWCVQIETGNKTKVIFTFDSELQMKIWIDSCKTTFKRILWKGKYTRSTK